MSRRTSPSFAIGGVSHLDHTDQPGDASVVPPEGGWRCFHCAMRFTNWRAAYRHFGDPSPGVERRPPLCVEDMRQLASQYYYHIARLLYRGKPRELTYEQWRTLERVLKWASGAEVDAHADMLAVDEYLSKHPL